MASVATETIPGFVPHRDFQAERTTDGRRHVAASHNSNNSQNNNDKNTHSSDLPRSASYTYIPHAAEAKLNGSSAATLHRRVADADLAALDNAAEPDSPFSSGWTTPDDAVSQARPQPDRTRDIVAELQKSPKITAQALNDAPPDSRSSLDSHVRGSSLDSSRTVSTVATTPNGHTPRISVNSNFSRKLNRRSWVGNSSPSSSSRSPSPHKKDSVAETAEKSETEETEKRPTTSLSKRRRSFIRRKDSAKTAKELGGDGQAAHVSDGQSDAATSRRPTTRRKKSRPISGLFKHAVVSEDDLPTRPKSRPSLPPLPKSFSTDKLPLSRPSQLSTDLPAQMPRLISPERSTYAPLTLPKKKDPLWSVFRDLDGEFTKFSSKTSAFKANVVRSSLLPFLRNYVNHPSNRSLRPEDLDRRAIILNKWWTGLVEMLHGRNNQSIAGTDRPAVLDGVSGIMERPEWRTSPSPFCPLSLRTKGASTPKNQSTTSLTSNASELLAESVHHNVRNIFTQNLRSQMAFVVDKMALRNAPASLVTFCGKACAYAFMFVPGMADVLVRLWDQPMDVIRRILQENEIGKFDNLSDVANVIIPAFPPALHQLGFNSLMKYMRKLRTPPPLPLGTANVQWWGPWLERWSGRESDLFYAFVKHYHILVTDFLPADATKKERMCAPGFALVHAQILTNLDATIHRGSNQNSQDSMTASSFASDDPMGDPDAVASTLPLPPTNAVRIMAENRLIMLIRDFLSDRAADHPTARQLFAESFNDILQTAVRGTSMFDHAACYTLLDFAEEALTLIVRYERMKDSGGTLINPVFWQTVSRKMVASQNTMTEIRLYAFLYAVWNTVVCDLDRKADLCFGFLLDPEIFESRFNHWCPMVRAYYMRLLCWRVGRYDGGQTRGDGDLTILETLLDRLQTSWAYYLYLREQADDLRGPPPPTIACNPAPNRRLLIIRTDGHNVSNNGTLLSFDSILPPSKLSASDSAPVSKRNSTLSMLNIDSRPDSSHSFSDEADSPRAKSGGLGGFLRGLMGSRSRSKSPTVTPTKTSPAGSPARVASQRPRPLTRSATDDPRAPSRDRRPSSTNESLSGSSTDTTSTFPPPSYQPRHRTFSFKFSLEFTGQPNKPASSVTQQPALLPPRLPQPAHHYLVDSGSVYTKDLTRVTSPRQPVGASVERARYCGRALAEWNVVLAECAGFFERRRHEGAPDNAAVETPTLGVEVFRRPG